MDLCLLQIDFVCVDLIGEFHALHLLSLGERFALWLVNWMVLVVNSDIKCDCILLILRLNYFVIFRVNLYEVAVSALREH